ncbi:MAG: hypothetical protein OIF48_11750 [Silicimonas sp.]|nr:hypothetical protein [Silicimonas sp.]
MFFRDVKPKKGQTRPVCLAQAHLPVKLGHRDAEKVFAAPLKAQLLATGLGTVLGCDTRARASGETLGVDLSLGLNRGTEAALRDVAALLETLSAPCGSSIRLADSLGDPLIFGLTEGLELAIDTPAAPDADSRRDLATACRGALDKLGVSRGWDYKRDQTVFYFYGESYAEMRQRLARVLKASDRYGAATIRRMA